jgi:hypothetical protein
MELRICPKDEPPIDCFHPYLGLINGATPGKPIYRAKQVVSYDLEIGQKVDDSAEVPDTDADSSSCPPDMTAVEPVTISDDHAPETDLITLAAGTWTVTESQQPVNATHIHGIITATLVAAWKATVSTAAACIVCVSG